MALRTLYDWTLQKAATPAAEMWLAVVAFIESSVFLIPADVLFVPMALAKPMRAYRYALTATLASTLGGLAGYLLGHYINPWLFIASCLVARGARFFALAWALASYGDLIRNFIERRLAILAGAAAGFILVVYVAVRFAF